ncbi:MAG TPA: hypothetical protein VGO81_11580 [Solirubrobacteraceae bacterium]|nr:hypothetical protein [Solirubrobacteraceae bacterium]
MARSGPAGEPRATRWEILGARLRIWTPPRDVEIPPVSRRAVATTIAVLVLATVAAVTLVAPAIDRAKRRTAAQERRTHATLVARERARLVVEQRARHGRSPVVARLHAAGRDAAARAALLDEARLHVERDVRARVAAGTLDGPIRDVRCKVRSRDAGPRVHVECLAATSIVVTPNAPTVYVGHPFVVGASLRDGRYAWCKENPPSGEGFAGQGVSVALPSACTR